MRRHLSRTGIGNWWAWWRTNAFYWAPLKISEPEKTISLEPALEIGEPEETPSIEPALELGKNEIALDLDDNPSITPAPPVAAAPLDEVQLSLEIDDSDDPLTIQSQDIPDLEIEDLGLELESSDDPAADKPWIH